MENSTLLLFSVLALALYLFNLLFLNHGKSKLPPGPKPLPILGNILQLTDKPHSALAELSKVHGPLMTLKLGHVNTLVVSSADMAREVFVKHDLAFSSRQIPDALRALNHNLYSMVWLPVSPKWRALRKLAVIELFSMKSLSESQPLRHNKVYELLGYVDECCKSGLSVNIGSVGFTTTLNLLSNTFFSKNLATYSSESSQELRDAVLGLMECAAKPNLADYFLVLSQFDPQRIKRNMATHFSKLFVVFDDMIEQRMCVDGAYSCVDVDVLDTLLRINRENGTDTTSITLEWVMTELLRNPSKMTKAKSELNEVLRNNKRKAEKIVKETDVQRLPYLQAIVKETLRLHPPGPLLVPHKACDHVQICGYHVPKNTQLLVNVWAIGHDPKTWKDPDEFLPERFLELVDIDFRGQDFELIPFGAGRRICPGLPLAHRMVHIMLATLLYGFDWKLPNGMRGQDLDMDEKFGISVGKNKPLLAFPISK